MKRNLLMTAMALGLSAISAMNTVAAPPDPCVSAKAQYEPPDPCTTRETPPDPCLWRQAVSAMLNYLFSY